MNGKPLRSSKNQCYFKLPWCHVHRRSAQPLPEITPQHYMVVDRTILWPPLILLASLALALPLSAGAIGWVYLVFAYRMADALGKPLAFALFPFG